MAQKIGIIGMGIWGTALSLVAARAGHEVLCWAREEEVVQSVNGQHVNRLYLPSVPLPSSIQAINHIEGVMGFADIILLVVPAQHTRATLEKMRPFVRPSTCIVLCAKGIETSTGSLLGEIVEQVMPGTQYAVLSGPGFAYEVALNKPTAVTIACKEMHKAQELVDLLGTQHFRPYSSDDIISPQIGGSVKNVLAIASGCIEGAGLGDNARAALITRGLNEMIRLSKALGGHARTMMGMCGLGDLVLTANCTQSRNFAFGFEVGQKGAAKDLLQSNTKTVEGIYTTPAVLKRAKEVGIDMPICETVNAVLFEGMSLQAAMDDLLNRPFKDEGF